MTFNQSEIYLAYFIFKDVKLSDQLYFCQAVQEAGQVLTGFALLNTSGMSEAFNIFSKSFTFPQNSSAYYVFKCFTYFHFHRTHAVLYSKMGVPLICHRLLL